MKDLLLTLTALEPLVISPGSAGRWAHECLGYVPGNMLLGALTTVWKRQNPGINPDDSPNFQRLFLNGEVSWGHALPLCEEMPTVPIPLCFARVKNHDALPLEFAQNNTDYCVFNFSAMKEDETVQDLWQSIHPNDKETIKTKKMPAGFMNPENLHLANEKMKPAFY